jgi:hypothetical protein
MASYPLLSKYTDALMREFTATHDKYEAQRKSAPILEEICQKPAFITEAIRHHISRPGALDRLHYPVLSFDLGLNPYFGLIINVWVPLPNGDTQLSTKAIHHHGDMLLSSGALFGPGYAHWTFTEPELMDESKNLYRMKLLGNAIHTQGEVVFVGDHVPHCPFFPSSLSLTLALWSSRHPSTWKDTVKRMPPFKGREKFFRKIAIKLGMAKALELKVVRDFDFYPEGEGFHSIPEREEFTLGPNVNYLQSFFHTVQGTGNDLLVPELQSLLDKGWVKDRETYQRFLSDLKSGRAIPAKLSDTHTNVHGFNFTSKDVESALVSCKKN